MKVAVEVIDEMGKNTQRAAIAWQPWPSFWLAVSVLVNAVLASILGLDLFSRSADTSPSWRPSARPATVTVTQTVSQMPVVATAMPAMRDLFIEQRGIDSAHSVSLSTTENGALFELLVLGSSGGPVEGKVSGYLMKVPTAGQEAPDLLVLDPGTLLSGIPRLQRAGFLPQTMTPISILRELVKGYLVTHPHLDHTASLLINSQSDLFGTKKPIIALQSTIDGLASSSFNNVAWPDLVNIGDLYEYRAFNETWNATTPSGAAQQTVNLTLNNNALTIRAWPVSHGASMISTCFLLSRADASSSSIILCGDMGPDSVETHGPLNRRVWTDIAPLIASRSLKAMMIECSYASNRSDASLFGHLTPRHVAAELAVLEGLVAAANAGDATQAYAAKGRPLDGLAVIITHIKDDAVVTSGEVQVARETVKTELEVLTRGLGVRIVLAYPGQRMLI
ncbi:hypothetical protein HK101_009971 [Irineochytrium annulatum]|nr:hypothetical protein HK101_009971 [Irineochytrium annulatum]